MKDHVEIGRLTNFDAFSVNRDQVIDLDTWFKIHTNVSKRPFMLHIDPKLFDYLPPQDDVKNNYINH